MILACIVQFLYYILLISFLTILNFNKKFLKEKKVPESEKSIEICVKNVNKCSKQHLNNFFLKKFNPGLVQTNYDVQ